MKVDVSDSVTSPRRDRAVRLCDVDSLFTGDPMYPWLLAAASGPRRKAAAAR